MANAGVHLYLAEKVMGNCLDSQQYFVGNIIPDVEHIMTEKKHLIINPKHKGSEHTAKKKMLQAFKDNLSLQRGIKVHLLVDDYVHNNYVAKKIKKFKDWRPELVHFLTELVMDRVLIKKNWKITKFYDKIVDKVKFNELGNKLEKIFPKSKFKGVSVLKDGIEILRIRNFTSWFRIYKTKRLLDKYNPFDNIKPSLFQIYTLINKLETDIKMDLDSFLIKAEKHLKKKLKANSF